MPPLELVEAAANLLERSEVAQPLLAEVSTAAKAVGRLIDETTAGQPWLLGPRNENTYMEATDFVRAAKNSGSQSIFVKANDRIYLASYQGNPQGDLTLPYRFLSERVAKYMGVKTPESAVLNISTDFIRANEAKLPAAVRAHIKPGPAFGALDMGPSSAYSLPAREISRVKNLSIYGKDMVLSGFLRDADGGQFLFTEAKDGTGWIARRIDFGHTFGGIRQDERMKLVDLYGDPGAYRRLSASTLKEHINHLLAMPESVLHEPLKQEIPSSWKANGRGTQIEDAVRLSFKNRGRVPEIIKDTIYEWGEDWFPKFFRRGHDGLVIPF